MINGYRELGYCIVAGLVPERLCDALVLNAMGKPHDGNMPLVMPHRDDPMFMEMLCYKPVVEIARELIGAPISALGSEYFYCAPGTKGFLPHQDNMYVQAPAGAFLHAWAALVDVVSANGCMQFWPMSHKAGMYPIEDINEESGDGQNIAARRSRTVIPEGYAPIDILMSKGDTVFFDSHLVHRSHDNVSQDFRHSWLCTYIKRGAPFNPGTKQKRVEIEL